MYSKVPYFFTLGKIEKHSKFQKQLYLFLQLKKNKSAQIFRYYIHLLLVLKRFQCAFEEIFFLVF